MAKITRKALCQRNVYGLWGNRIMLDQYTRHLYAEKFLKAVLIIVPLSLLAALVAILVAG
tara:strand:- start:204 stop:383 length:180 start_codon:yes stop_codon:yes gene_type:complete